MNKLNRLLAIPRLRRRDRGHQRLRIPLCKTTKTPQLQEHENLHLDLLQKNWTNMNSRMLCFVPGVNTISSRATEDPHRCVATHEGRTPKVMLDWMFFTSDQEPGVQLPVLVVNDLSTGAVMATQSTKDSSVVTVGAVVQTLETWGHTVVLHAGGEPATKSLVRSVANARVHRTLPRHGPPLSHQSQGLVEACIQVYRGIFVANKLALEAGIGCRHLLKHPAVVWLVRHVAWLIHQIQHWTRWMLSFQEDLWEVPQWWHLQVW